MDSRSVSDKDCLQALCQKLNVVARLQGIELRLVEIKGTVYFFPQLPALLGEPNKTQED